LDIFFIVLKKRLPPQISQDISFYRQLVSNILEELFYHLLDVNKYTIAKLDSQRLADFVRAEFEAVRQCVLLHT
jgi:hypothetical protein